MVSTTTYLSDTIKFLRNDLRTNITDPISATRVSTSRFVMTSYPSRPTQYPLITIRGEGMADIQKMGMRSELKYIRIPVEIRIWARNEAEKDHLTEQVVNRLRTNQYDGGASSSDDEGLHDFTIVSATPVDEIGESAIKSMVLIVNFSHVLGE